MTSQQLSQKKKTNAENTSCIRCPRCDQILIFGAGKCFFGPKASITCRNCGLNYKGEETYTGEKWSQSGRVKTL